MDGTTLAHLCNVFEMLSTVTSVNGVASPSRPRTAPTLLISASTKCPASIDTRLQELLRRTNGAEARPLGTLFSLLADD